MEKSKTKRYVLLVVVYLLVIGSALSQEIKFDMKQFTSDRGEVMNYRLLTPDYDTLRKYPLIVFLHGAGERGNDNRSQLKWGVMNFATDEMMSLHPAFVVAPQCPENLWWFNFDFVESSNNLKLRPEPSKPMELVIGLVEQLKSTLPIDIDRIYITGVSMGGMGTFDAIQRYPDLFAAAVPVCGGGDISRANEIAHIPIWVFHGAEDPTVSPQLSSKMVEALTLAGGHPGFTLYPEVGHFSWLMAYSDHLMIEWMFRQHK
ncbi:prolyl oligopeptidase family serine peptidase [Fulvivirga sp. 29W222]|uniref:Prolyl oligopeptidase family serine peptidase n=1 Tax=Fulvivirga marina TaxID=2494733 RepID=A0A937FW39_9BACT|nr:prolyl oligopeptidase family serine peptidase [Fulvivirga marina]MBL6447104.1 prolyl oligopeptidase family serine peptidase [Fulvivirga marina]